jgi:hypothetical protein
MELRIQRHEIDILTYPNRETYSYVNHFLQWVYTEETAQTNRDPNRQPMGERNQYHKTNSSKATHLKNEASTKKVIDTTISNIVGSFSL